MYKYLKELALVKQHIRKRLNSYHEIINENLTLDAFKREDARAKIRMNIRRLLQKYNYPPVKRESAVEQVIKQAELKYQEV